MQLRSQWWSCVEDTSRLYHFVERYAAFENTFVHRPDRWQVLQPRRTHIEIPLPATLWIPLEEVGRAEKEDVEEARFHVEGLHVEVLAEMVAWRVESTHYRRSSSFFYFGVDVACDGATFEEFEAVVDVGPDIIVEDVS